MAGKVTSNYTNLHLSALTFLHPPNPPDHLHQCQCQVQPEQQQKIDQIKHSRVYHTEPSGYPYNSDSYLIKESRYSTLHGWHSSSDDLVADDAGVGSAVCGVGWWIEGGEGGKDAWERTNRSLFSPAVSDDFDADPPKPDALVQPTPGWKSTPLYNSESKSNVGFFPAIRPLPTTKIAAIHCHDGSTHVFCQATDGSILEFISHPGEGWFGGEEEKDVVVRAVTVVQPGEAKFGSPLAVVAGGWGELRVFFVDEEDSLGEAYSDYDTEWMESELPSYKLDPTAMITAVAWNFGSPFFEIRIYTTNDNDDLLEIAFSRNSGGWKPSSPQSVSGILPETLPKAATPLSAVAAVRGECDRKTNVYYHPKRTVIAEWDVCAKTPVHAGITKVCEGAIKRRAIEEETRRKIEEEKVRLRKIEEDKERQRKIEEEKERQRQLAAKPEVAPPEVQKKIDKIGACTAGFPWKKAPGGYRCEAGGHFLSDFDIARA